MCSSKFGMQQVVPFPEGQKGTGPRDHGTMTRDHPGRRTEELETFKVRWS